MLQTLAITGPIYLVIALGFLAGRAGTFSKLDMRVLGTYVVKFALRAGVHGAVPTPGQRGHERPLCARLCRRFARRDDGRLWWHRILVQSLTQLSRNPVILAIAGGLAVSLIGIPITGVLARTINMLAMSSAAVSLFVIGGTLTGLKTKGMRRDVTTIALGKLLLHPLAVGLMMWLVPPNDPTLRAAAVVFAATPMLSIYPILAQKYGFEEMCAAALLLATVLSFLTISVALWLLGPVLGWAA